MLATIRGGFRAVAPAARAAVRSVATSSGRYAAFEAEIESIKAAGTYKRERVITSPQGGVVRVDAASLAASGKPAPPPKVINMCANNYIGLASHPEVIAAAHKTLDTHGFGLASVRFICGTQDIHKQLEGTIARYHGMEDAILFPSCFDANAGIFEALLTKEDAIISDELNHASIIDGIRLCKAQRHVYKHLDMADLEAKLQASQGARLRLIATDGAFSMDGDIAPLKEIVALAKKYNALTFSDECHSTGFFGPTGRGVDEFWGVFGQIDIINSTLGKGLGGGTGGYTASSRPIVDLLRQRARPYLFSNSVAPPIVGASLKVFEMLEKDSSFVTRVRSMTHRFREGMAAAGFTVSGHRDHPICPVMLGDARLAAEFADEMLARGVYVVGFSFPVVPRGKARIRTQISAALTDAEIEHALAAFIEVGKKLKVIA